VVSECGEEDEGVVLRGGHNRGNVNNGKGMGGLGLGNGAGRFGKGTRCGVYGQVMFVRSQVMILCVRLCLCGVRL
jgi:hypothetical protein